jgi:outer membrane protein OmpA-like peptidoglycan-associated protein
VGKLKPGGGAPAPVLLNTPNRSSNSIALSYGVGAKYNVSPRWGLRFDVDGMRSATPHFNLPAIPTVPGILYIPPHGHESSLTATVGVIFNIRYHYPAAPAPPPPPPPPAPKADVQVSAITGLRDVCPSEDLPLSVTARGWLPDQTPSYQWMVNGNPVGGTTSNTFNVPTIDPGPKTVTVRVSAGDSSATSEPVTVNVKPLTPPTLQFSVPQSTVAYGARLNLAATATGSECGGPVTVRYSGEGVSGNTFDSTALNFDQTNRLKQQTRTVHITATATDTKNQTASAGADVGVTLTAQARRLDDLVFPANSSRVNNCAKRLLLEELTPMLRSDPDARVLLIGHRDGTESARARPPVDEARVLNAAAVLSAGKGICPSLDLSRIKVNWVGTEQSSEARPALCGTSTNVKERGGSRIREADKRVQFRRVEVWIVPGGADMPAGVNGMKDASPRDITPKGCPR